MGRLQKYPKIHVSTGEESSGFGTDYTQDLRSRHSRRISKGGALHRKGERNSRVVPPFPESPRYISPFQGNLFSLHCLDFQGDDRLTPRWHVGLPCGKASWESLKRKPQIP